MIKNIRQINNHSQIKRPSSAKKSSLSKSIGELRKINCGEENPLIAIQKIHLFRKQKSFLAKQAIVFEKKSKALKEQIKELDEKIKNQKEIAVSMVKNLEIDKTVDEVEKAAENKKVFKVRSRSNESFARKKSFFKLNY